MIIIHFLLFSCLNKKSDKTFLEQRQLNFFSLSEKNERKKAILTATDTQEKSQLLWLEGLESNSIEALIEARSIGISCLQEGSSFSINKIQEPEVMWSQFSWFPENNCDQDNASQILRINKTSKNTACVTWTILSWSKLLQQYRFDKGSIDAHRIFYLAAWLSENEGCIESKWTALAIAIAQLQMEDDPRLSISKKELRALALRRLEILFNDQELKNYVLVWYMLHRLRTEQVAWAELESWKTTLEEWHHTGEDVKHEPFISEIREYLLEDQSMSK